MHCTVSIITHSEVRLGCGYQKDKTATSGDITTEGAFLSVQHQIKQVKDKILKSFFVVKSLMSLDSPFEMDVFHSNY